VTNSYVVFSGNIGSGKSTLAQILETTRGYMLWPEAVDELLYVRDFYDDMGRWAFHNQLDFLSRKAQQAISLVERRGRHCQDRCLAECYEVFSKKLYEDGLISTRDFEVLTRLYSMLSVGNRVPDLVVHVHARQDVLFDRIGRRAREHEVGISREWLAGLEERYDQWLSAQPARVLRLDTSELDPTTSPSHRSFLLDEIEKALPR